jgi:hypothetical protein
MDQMNVPPCPYGTTPSWMNDCRNEWAKGWNQYFEENPA